MVSSSSEYENLSNNTLNDILANYPNQVAKTGTNLLQFAKPRLHQPPNLPPPPVPQTQTPKPKPIYTDDSDSVMSCQLITSSNLLLNRNTVRDANLVSNLPPKFTPHLKQAASKPPITSKTNNDTDSESGMSCQLISSSNLLLNRNVVRDARQISNKEASSNLPPQLTTQFKQQTPQNDTDSDSVMSCQLITSSSLLLNRNTVKEAHNVVDSTRNKNMYHQSGNVKALPPLNPRHFLTTQPRTNESTTQTTQTTLHSNEVNNCPESDASKPPPMETAI